MTMKKKGSSVHVDDHEEKRPVYILPYFPFKACSVIMHGFLQIPVWQKQTSHGSVELTHAQPTNWLYIQIDITWFYDSLKIKNTQKVKENAFNDTKQEGMQMFKVTLFFKPRTLQKQAMKRIINFSSASLVVPAT